MITREYIFCAVCNSIVGANKFINHTSAVHKTVLENFDIALRIDQDRTLVNARLDELNKNKNKKQNTEVRRLADFELKAKKKEQKLKEQLAKKKKEERSRILREEEQRSKTKMHYIIWDDILFEKDRVAFAYDRINTHLNPVELKGVFAELNTLKDEYFKRLHGKDLYKLYFYQATLLKAVSPDWERIAEKIEIGKQHFEFKPTRKNKFGPALSLDEALRTYGTSFKKSQYLKYLASIQSKDFKLIPIIEASGRMIEDSFIFRIQTKTKRVLSIWENLNPNRATHIFSSSQASHDSMLRNVESFICTEMTSKRALLYLTDTESIKMKKKLGYLSTLRHTAMESFKTAIKKLIRT